MFTLAKSLALLPVVAASPLRLGTFTESIPPYQRWSEETRSISGGAPRMSDLIFDAMGFDVEIVDLGSFRDAQAKSIAALDRGEIDIAWAYGPQRLRWPAGFHLTEPILTVDRRAMVRKETRTSRPTFSIFQPFERNLWLAIVGAIVVAAGVFYVLDLLWHEETPSSHSFLYHAAALLLRGEEYVTFSPASRWFRVGFLFTALILTATYTAGPGVAGPRARRRTRAARRRTSPRSSRRGPARSSGRGTSRSSARATRASRAASTRATGRGSS